MSCSWLWVGKSEVVPIQSMLRVCLLRRWVSRSAKIRRVTPTITQELIKGRTRRYILTRTSTLFCSTAISIVCFSELSTGRVS